MSYVQYLALFFLIVIIVSFTILLRNKKNNISVPDMETEMLRNKYTLEEYTETLDWMFQMGIIDVEEYEKMYLNGLTYLK